MKLDAFLLGQLWGQTGDVGQQMLMYLLGIVPFILFFMFYNKIQMFIWLRDIEKALNKLKIMRDEARRVAIESVKEVGGLEEDPSPQVDQFLEYFFIEPTSLDPAGIVWKLDHLLDVRESKFKDHVRRMAPKASEAQLNNLENLLEVALDLNTIYRIVRHYYLFGKKTMSFYLVMQLQMILPLIMQTAEAYVGALQAFSLGQPIGDGIGALVASKLMLGAKRRPVEKDMVVGEVNIEGRTVLVTKAEGPGGNVGKPGDAVKALIEENAGRIALIIMVDAGLKLEGEKLGEVIEGVGAAIGGVGTEKYKIEEVATKYKIPVQAVIIKESIRDAISPMKKELYDSVNAVIDKIKRLIVENTKEGDTVLVAGIGNTIGIL